VRCASQLAAGAACLPATMLPSSGAARGSVSAAARGASAGIERPTRPGPCQTTRDGAGTRRGCSSANNPDGGACTPRRASEGPACLRPRPARARRHALPPHPSGGPLAAQPARAGPARACGGVSRRRRRSGRCRVRTHRCEATPAGLWEVLGANARARGVRESAGAGLCPASNRVARLNAMLQAQAVGGAGAVVARRRLSGSSERRAALSFAALDALEQPWSRTRRRRGLVRPRLRRGPRG